MDDNVKPIKSIQITVDKDGKLLQSISAPNASTSKPPDNAKQFSCDKCGKRFHLKINLRKHKLRHASAKSLMCDICGKVFQVSRNPRRHKLTHTSKKLHTCDICGKAQGNYF